MASIVWDDVKGHEHVKALLRDCCLTGRVPHALIFAGPRGVGKTRLALEFFMALNCQALEGQACGSCPSCIKAASGNHPDLVTITPRGSWIVVDDVRDVIGGLALRPFEGRTRFMVIESAEALNVQAANALLKTLEEPPDSTVIVLVSHRPTLLLPTVISRCRLIRFQDAPGRADMSDRGGQGDGSAGVDEPGAGAAGTVEDDLLAVLAGADPALLAKRYFDRDDPELLGRVLDAAQSIARDMLVIRAGSTRVLNQALLSMDPPLAPLEEIDGVLEAIRGLRRGAHENVNVRIGVTELFIRLGRLGAGRS
jgi:DNA polymerase-3 subunit delta'